MSKLGRSAVFVLKHWDAMSSVDWDDYDPKRMQAPLATSKLPEKMKVWRQMGEVFDKGCNEIGVFMMTLAEGIAANMCSAVTAKLRSRPKTMRYTWYACIDLFPRRAGRRRTKAKKLEVQLYVLPDFDARPGPWLVSSLKIHPPSEETEAGMARILGKRRIHSRSSEIAGWAGKGWVFFAPILLYPPSHKGWDMPMDSIVKECVGMYGGISDRDMKRLCDLL